MGHETQDNDIYAICNATRDPSYVHPCSPSITIALVRHAVLTALPEEKEKLEVLKTMAPRQPSHLRSPADVVVLGDDDCARYGIRGMRSGHVYFFAKRANASGAKWGLDGYFQTLPAGIYGKSSELAQQYYPETVAQASQLLTHCADPLSRTVKILNPRDVQELRVLFTPHALGAQRVKAILGDEALRSKIQLFKLADIVDVPADRRIKQPDVIARDGLDQSIAEMIAVKEWGKAELQYTAYSEEISDEDIIYRQPGFALLQEQYFSIPDANSGLGGSWAWEKLPDALKSADEERLDEGVAFVLEDPIGITEELNAWRNEVYVQFKKHYLEKEMAAPTGYAKITKEWQIDTVNMISDLEANYSTYSKYASISPHWLRYIQAKISMVGAIGAHRQYQHLVEHPHIEAAGKAGEIYFRENQLAAIQAAKDASRQIKTWWANLDAAVKQAFPEYGEFNPPENFPNSISTAELAGGTLQSNYGRYYNYTQYEALKKEYDSTWAEVKKEIARRAPYHLAWLADEGTPLLDALEMYDPTDQTSGVYFTSVVGNCIEGMGADEDSYEQLYIWLSERDNFKTDNKSNLLARALCFNRKDLQQELVRVLEATRRRSDDSPNDEAVVRVVIENSSKVLDLMQQMFGAADEMFKSGPLQPVRYGRVMTGVYTVVHQLPGVYTVVHQLHMATLGTARNNFADRALHYVLRLMVVGSVTNSVVDVSRFNVKEIAARVLSRADVHEEIEEVLRTQMNKDLSQLAQVRLAGAVTLLRGLHTIMQLNACLDENASNEQLITLLGAALMTASSGCDLAGTFAQAAANQFKGQAASSAKRIGTQQQAWAYRMWGARLGIAGGGFNLLATLSRDIPNIRQALYQKRWGLASAYLLGIAVDALLFIGAIDMYSGAGGILGSYKAHLSRKAFADAAARSAQVAAVRQGIVNRGIFYRLGGTAGVMRGTLKRGNVITVLTTATIVIPVGISFYEGKTIKLEEWLEATALRNSSSGMKPYPNANEEMQKFAEALMGFTHKTPVTLKDIEYPQELDWVKTHLDEMIAAVNQIAAQEDTLQQELEQVRRRPPTLIDYQD